MVVVNFYAFAVSEVALAGGQKQELHLALCKECSLGIHICKAYTLSLRYIPQASCNIFQIPVLF